MRMLRNRWMLIIILLVGTLGGCGRGISTSQTAEDVHAQWVQAMRQNDRATLLRLAAELQFKESFVDASLRRVHDKMMAASSPTGRLQDVDINGVTDDGQQKVGVSVWRFTKRTDCYRTEMTPTDAGWKVSGWGTMLHCP
jgi:hypothetical protein